MKLIDKYIVREFVVPFGYCFLTFILLFIIGDLFENLDDFLEHKIPFYLISQYYLFLIPVVFTLTTPLAILLSLLYILGYMTRYNELCALKSSGISFWRIIVPFGSVGIILSLLVFYVNERWVPVCSSQMDYIYTSYLKKKIPIGTKEEIKNISFFSPVYNMGFYIDKMDKNRIEVFKISVREFYEKGQIKREWYARGGRWLDNSWWLLDGYIKGFNSNGEMTGNIEYFKKKELKVNVSPRDLEQSRGEIEKLGTHMNFSKLRNYVRRNYVKTALPKELLVELYRKPSIPVTVLVATIFGIAFGARISKGGAIASVGYSIGLYLVYYGVTSFLLALGKMGKVMPFLAVWTPQIAFGIIAGILLKRTR